MTKQDFIKKFPDVKVQQFETDTVLSKQEIKEMVKQFTNSLDMGLIYYEQCGCNVTVFTSDKMKSELNKRWQKSRFSRGVEYNQYFHRKKLILKTKKNDYG